MRSLAEWLVLPLFLVPVLLLAGLALFARDRERTTLDAYRRDGTREAESWLAPSGAAAWVPDEVRRRFAPDRPARGPASERVPFTSAAGEGEVLLGESALGRERWRLAAEFPEGIGPAALADPRVRLQVEAGTPPAAVQGADAGTVLFRRLLQTPDLDLLRQAPLPAATKRYLVRRWEKRKPGDPRLPDAERLLGVLERFQERTRPGVALPLGSQDLQGLLVLSGGDAWPVLLVPDPSLLPPVVVEAHGAEGEPMFLTWSFPPEARPKGDVLWTGTLEAPLAGTWRFALPPGHTFWDAPPVRRWAAPAIVLTLLLLAFPGALLVSMRRRRLRDEARARFLNELAHDLRTPLTSLRLHADLLLQGKGDRERRERHLQTVGREAARLSALLSNLLDLTRLDGGPRRLEAKELRTGEVVGGALDAFGAIHPERSGDVIAEGPADVVVRADPASLARVLANLLDNAGKFSDPGTPIRVGWRREGADVAVTVADEGCGIPPKERPRVFRRYVRGAEAKRRGVPGTGMGLALVTELLAEMGGSVRLADAPRGATFEVRLPGGNDA